MKNIVARLTVVGAIFSLGIAAHAQTPSIGWDPDPIKPKTISWGNGSADPKAIRRSAVVSGNPLQMGISLISWGN
jgi:hypothetical protein